MLTLLLGWSCLEWNGGQSAGRSQCPGKRVSLRSRDPKWLHNFRQYSSESQK